MAKTNLVLLPGLLCDDFAWQNQKEALADIANVTIADLTPYESIGAMAEAVLADVPDNFALAGLSMGGYVALEIMRRAPERVERLALVDTAAHTDSEEQTKLRQQMIGAVEAGMFEQVFQQLAGLLVYKDAQADEQLMGGLTAMAKRVGADVFVRQTRAIMQRPDSTGDLANIKCPALVMCGKYDNLFSADIHKAMADKIPGANLVFIDDCGHSSSVEKPEAVNKALREWLG